MYPNYFEEGYFDRQVPASDDPLSIEPRLYWESLKRCGCGRSLVDEPVAEWDKYEGPPTRSCAR